MPQPGDPVGRDALEALAVEGPVARVGAVEAGEQVEERRLAGAVGPDQAGDHAALDLDVVDVDGGEAAERAADAVGDHDRVGLLRAGLVGDVAQRRAGGVDVDLSVDVPASSAGRGCWSRCQRASRASSLRSPKIPCGRKIISSIRARPMKMKRIRLAWLLFMIDVGDQRVGARGGLAEEQVEEADQEPEDHRSGDRAEHPGGATDQQHGVGEERGVGGEERRVDRRVLQRRHDAGERRRSRRRCISDCIL